MELKELRLKEPLQTEIENKAKAYVKSFGYDKYYDPKQLTCSSNSAISYQMKQ